LSLSVAQERGGQRLSHWVEPRRRVIVLERRLNLDRTAPLSDGLFLFPACPGELRVERGRGGSWCFSPRPFRSASRTWNSPAYRFNTTAAFVLPGTLINPFSLLSYLCFLSDSHRSSSPNGRRMGT